MKPATEKVADVQVVYYGPRDVKIEPMNKPQCRDGEVLIEIEACAICGTDIKTYSHGNQRITPPNTMGHEFCGTIIEIGAGARDYNVGQRVTMATSIGCGDCFYCHRGLGNLCRSLKAIGFHYPGAMARWLRVPALAVQLKQLVPVGQLDASVAALSEPLSCAINNISHVPQEEIKNALIIGLGPLGLLHGEVLRQMNIETLVGVQRPGKRQDFARRRAYDKVIAPGELPGAYRDLTDGRGFDLIIVTAPNNAIQAESLNYARKGGYVSLFASLPVGDEFLSMNSRTIHYNELFVFGSSDSTPHHVHKAVQLLQAAPQAFRSLITSTLPFIHFEQAIERIQSGSEIKVVLHP